MFKGFLAATLLLIGQLHAEYITRFPGFRELEKNSSFVGIVEVERLDGEQDYYSSYRFVSMRSQLILKGRPIESEVARIYDSRITELAGAKLKWPEQSLITPGERFLVFLSPAPPAWAKGRYKWEDHHCEGTILPVAPLTQLDELDVKKPLEAYAKIVADYSKYCDQMAACARSQKELIEQMTKDGK